VIVFAALPESLHLAWTPVTARVDDLGEQETEYAALMVERRRHAFAAGRRAARLALTQLGLAVADLPRDALRAPIWPGGVLGAITHSDRLAGAVVARAGSVQGLGLDVEEIGRVGDDVAERICTVAEWRVLAGLPADVRRQRAALTFSAKECVHKAWAPISGVTLPFEAVEIEVLSASRFCVHPRDLRLMPWPSKCWSGWYGIADGAVRTLLQLMPE